MKDTLTETKNNLQGVTVEQRKLKIRSATWNVRKKKTFNQNSKKKKESKKNKDRLRSLRDNFKCTNIQIIGMPEGEEKE